MRVKQLLRADERMQFPQATQNTHQHFFCAPTCWRVHLQGPFIAPDTAGHTHTQTHTYKTRVCFWSLIGQRSSCYIRSTRLFVCPAEKRGLIDWLIGWLDPVRHVHVTTIGACVPCFVAGRTRPNTSMCMSEGYPHCFYRICSSVWVFWMVVAVLLKSPITQNIGFFIIIYFIYV